jgi:hypothetical protein
MVHCPLKPIRIKFLNKRLFDFYRYFLSVNKSIPLLVLHTLKGPEIALYWNNFPELVHPLGSEKWLFLENNFIKILKKPLRKVRWQCDRF